MFKKRDIFQLFNTGKKNYNGILINANICKIAKNKHQNILQRKYMLDYSALKKFHSRYRTTLQYQ